MKITFLLGAYRNHILCLHIPIVMECHSQESCKLLFTCITAPAIKAYAAIITDNRYLRSVFDRFYTLSRTRILHDRLMIMTHRVARHIDHRLGICSTRIRAPAVCVSSFNCCVQRCVNSNRTLFYSYPLTKRNSNVLTAHVKGNALCVKLSVLFTSRES